MTLDIQAFSKRLQELGFSIEQADGLAALQKEREEALLNALLETVQAASSPTGTSQSQPAQRIRGRVTELAAKGNYGQGEIRVRDILAGSPRDVYVLLESEDYRKAISAHGDCRMVELSGRLVQSGPELRLMPCCPLEVLPTNSDADGDA